jgi:G3E family GTPase
LKEVETAREQIRMADFILLNKTDLVDEAGLQAAEAEIRALNAQATLFRTNQSEVNLRNCWTCTPLIWTANWRWIRSFWMS